VSVLGRKARRDLARQRWQYLSVGITVFLGVALYAASYDAFLNLEQSYEQTYDRLAFADVTITGGDSAALAEQAAALDGVDAVTVRRQADIGIRLDGNHILLGRIVELPDPDQPAVNQVDVLTGSLPTADDGGSALVERHMSDHFGLEPGAKVEVRAATAWRSLDVAGTVASPEYIWPARSRQDLLTSPDDFGVIFVPTSGFDELVGSSVTQTLVRFASSADSAALLDALDADAGAAGASSVETRDEQPSNAALQEDVAGFGELSFLFPMLFLGAAAMATFILIGRVVRSQQTQVASLRANGMGTRQIVVHYLGEGMTITMAAGLLGVVVGVAAGRVVTGLYTDAITVPDTVTTFHLGTVVSGLVLAALTGAIAAAAPAMAAARTPPAAALRGVTPTGSGGRSLIERIVPSTRRLPARWRMVLRGIGRDRRRTLSTAIGVVLALVLILASWGMVDTVDILLDRQFNEVQRQDAQLYLDPSAGDAVAQIERTNGIEVVETVTQTGVVVSHRDRRYATELLAFDSPTQMHDFDASGDPGAGVVAGRSLGSLLGVDVGDTVTVASAESPAAVELAVVGFVDEPLGTFVYSGLDAAAELTSSEDLPSVMVSFSPGVDRAAMRQTLTEIPGVVAYLDSRALYDTAQNLLSLFYAFVGVMAAFGCIMAFALIFNTATVNTAERSPELAALKVNGASSGQLARLLAGENLLLTVVSIVPGLVIGYAVSAAFMASFSSDLFDFGLEMRGRTLVLAALAVLAVSALAQWPGSRTVAGLDVARVVRERSQ
jgi:putative ABC transport system permease protein